MKNEAKRHIKTIIYGGNKVKKHLLLRKVLSMILTVSILISLLPFENIFAAWTTPNNITINDSTGSSEISYFKNLYGTPQDTNMYYVAGQPEDIAYCIDAEATGPGGTAYVINDSAIDVTFRAGLARIAQYGYPTQSWTAYGISATEAQYATQAAMHWWENVVLAVLRAGFVPVYKTMDVQQTTQVHSGLQIGS